jgi:hypothetical protein
LVVVGGIGAMVGWVVLGFGLVWWLVVQDRLEEWEWRNREGAHCWF